MNAPALAAVPLDKIGNVAATLAAGAMIGLAKKPRAKRARQFVIDRRSVPSLLGTFVGKEPGPWICIDRSTKLAAMRSMAHDLTDQEPGAGFFTRGTEYRVRRIDPPAAA